MDADFFLMQKMKNGDEDAVETFVRKYYPVILRYCGYHTANRQDAEDLTQETFARFFASFADYRHRGKALRYLYVIAGNLCKDLYRRRAELPFEEISAADEITIARTEEKMQMEKALQALPKELRETVILYYFQGLKQKEIAEILQIGLPLVKYRLARAKSELRKYLSADGDA